MSGNTPRTDVLLVCSAGGHLFQLVALRGAWEGFSRAWVTLDGSGARSLLAGEEVYFASGATSRNMPKHLLAANLARNALLAVRLAHRLRPKVVLTTGSGLAVPFAWAGRLWGARVVYVESITRITGPSAAYRLIAPVAERLYVQWPELARSLRRARYAGNVFGS
jgi:UDP-N-acetylglucosamine:LPS N-acetylglucosamine transferase